MKDRLGRKEIFFYTLNENGYPIELFLNLSDVEGINFKELRLCFNEQFGEGN